MSLIESNSLNFSHLVYLLRDILLHRFDILVVVQLALIDHVLQDYYLQPLSHLIDIVIPRKLLFLLHFRLNLLSQALLFCLTTLIVLLFLIKCCLFNSNLESTSNFFIIQILYCHFHTFLSCIGYCSISFGKAILIFIDFNLLFSCVQVNTQYSCLVHKFLQFLLCNIQRKSRNIDKCVNLRTIPFFFLLLCLTFGLLFVLLFFQKLLFSQRNFRLHFFLSMYIFLPSLVFLSEEEFSFEFAEEQLFHFFNFFSRLLILLHPFPFFLIINIPFSIGGLVEGLLDEVVDCRFEDGKGVLILVLDDLIIILLSLLVLSFFGLLRLFKQVLPLLFDLKDLFRRLKDAGLDLFDLVEIPPLLHAVLPGEGLRTNIVCAQKYIQVPQRKRSSCFAVDQNVPYLFIGNLEFALFVHIYYKIRGFALQFIHSAIDLAYRIMQQEFISRFQICCQIQRHLLIKQSLSQNQMELLLKSQ